MSVPNSLRYACKLTCEGGSEKGTCDCQTPNQCVMREHPNFAEYRAAVIRGSLKRMGLPADWLERDKKPPPQES